MKKIILFCNVMLALVFSNTVFAQNLSSQEEIELKKKILSQNKNIFNEEAAILEAKAKGIKESEINGYVQFLRDDFSSKKALEKQHHKHTPYETPQEFQETVIYLNPNRTASTSCPNMGFEDYNFTGWTGGKGTVATGPVGTSPVYTSTGLTILSAAGPNVSVRNTTNYHTILTRPTTTNNLFPTCSSYGYDSLACNAFGSANYSQIPFVSPFSFDPVSARLNGAVANYRGSRIKYITTTSATNKMLSFSYAVILQDPLGHAAEESPYFKVEVKNEGTGAILPGCTSYTFNPKSTVPSDSLFTSSIAFGGEVVRYRKWQYYTVDLSSLPVGTNVSVNFEVGGCSLSGHWGYAYVDAECGGVGTPYANMCSGSTLATLVAPGGFSSYQWLNPAGIPIFGATNDTLIVNPATVGDVYSVQMVSPGGCVVTMTVGITLTSVSIISINATSSCAGGSSGTAIVVASGSSGVYNYTWTSTSGPTTGSIVSTSQLATGLPPGTYSVNVEATTCGSASANIVVGVSPAFYSSSVKPFCGNSALIPASGGTGYTWYGGTATTQTLIPAPAGTNDTLFIPTAIDGNVYTLVYNNPFGCRDSIRYTLSQIPGGTTFFSSINNVCPGNTNGSATLNLSTSFPSPYNYYITGTGGLILNSTTASTNVTVSSLAVGVYTAVVNDGVCIYNNTFTISTINTSFTATPTNTVLCFPTSTAQVNFNFGESPPTSCGVDPSLCSGPPTQLFSVGPFVSNSATTYPTPFSGWWYSAKHQFLVKVADLNAAGITAGKISSLAFNITALNSSPLIYPDYQIKMGCTALNDLPTGVGQPFITGLTTVYTNPSQAISLGWLTHNFSQSYVWDGTSNIIIEVCTGGLTTFPANASIELKQMPYIANMKSASSSSGVSSCPDVATTALGTYMASGANMLPNMKFGYCGASLPASSYTISVSSNGTVTANYANDSILVVPTFTAPPAGNVPTIYTITVTNPIGLCTATQTVAILYPSSTINMTTVPTSTTICEGSTINLSATGAVNYNWSYFQSGGLTPIATTQSISVTPPHVGLNYYVVNGTSPCPGTPDTKTITVTVTPKANLLITPLQDVTKCLDKPYVITTGVGSTTPGNPGTPFSYTWTALPSSASVGSSSSYTANSNSTTTLVVTVSGPCAFPTKDTIVIKNFVNDLAISILDTSTTCANTPFALNSFVTGGYPAYNFSWYIDGVTSPISNSPVLNYVSPGGEGHYTVGLYVTDSCGYNKAAYEVINVLPPCNVLIPNVITPNGDGVNEYFIIKNLEHHPNTAVTIYDRWGLKVYETSNYNNDWKADGSSDGTFFYVVDVPDDKKYSGFITVYHGK